MNTGVKQRTTHIKNGGKEPVEKNDIDTNVRRGPPRVGKRRAFEGADLSPVECEDTHGQAVGDAKELIDCGIVGSYPADPGKARESGKEIGREKV